MVVVMGTSLVPIPLFDLVALTSVQLKMLYSLTRLYEVPFSKNLGKSFHRLPARRRDAHLDRHGAGEPR